MPRLVLVIFNFLTTAIEDIFTMYVIDYEMISSRATHGSSDPSDLLQLALESEGLTLFEKIH